MNILIEKLLESRGITHDKWEEYNNSEHDLLHDIDELCSQLEGIRESDEKIIVLPDFDMDGIMSATVGYAGLSLLGFDVDLFIPNPKDGYGFSAKQIDQIVDNFPEVKAIITCDTGIGCRAGVAHAKDIGLKVLITDHHQEQSSDDPLAEPSPRGLADAIVNPCSIGETYEHPAICGAHVLWQVLDRFAELYEDEEMRRRISFLRVFAGIGTISDTMPVLWENRQLIKDSIEICKKVWETSPDFLSAIKDAPQGFSDAFRGVYAVLNMFAGAGKLKDPSDLDETFFGYYLAPSFNAVKRMDGDMSRAYDVFRGATPSANVEYLLALNEQRKKVVDDAMSQIDEQDNPYDPICYITDAPHGILGLLAMKFHQRYGLPCVVVRKNKDGSFSGSGRSPEWYPVAELSPDFNGCFAGHAGAFGCRFSDQAQLESFYHFTLAQSTSMRDELIESGAMQPPYDIIISNDGNGDADFDRDLLIDFIEELETLRPFGRGFEEPQILISFGSQDGQWNVIGKNRDHLKISLPTTSNPNQTLDVLCWGQAEFASDRPNGRIYALGTLSLNEFRGKITPQFTGAISTDISIA